MYRLGLQLVLKGGREVLVRLLLTTVAVAVGVTILLGVLADFHAFQKTSNRPSWESTQGQPVAQIPSNAQNAMLWNYSENIYKGQFIEQLNIAALGTNAPVLPGISRLPQAGQFYASPALSALLRTVPKDELGDRFQGTQIGTIGEAALSFPNELAIFEGTAPSQLVQQKGTMAVTKIATAAQLQGTTNIYREAFGIGALAVLFPLLILINTATRLSATRREERYAAMRLIGATPHQINVIASVDAIVGALLGSLLGCLVFLAVRPAIADISFSGVKFFPNYVTPTVWGYVGMIAVVPIIAAIASLVSLRRIQISPLGVSRKTAPPKPGIWRLVPLIAGIIIFPYAASVLGHNHHNGSPTLLFGGFLLIMIGIVLSGSWLTMQVTTLFAKVARSAPSLLAARRLSDNPKAAFRTVSGIILAVFVGSIVAVLVPVLNQAQNPTGQTSLSSVLRVPYNNNPFNPGVPPEAAAALVHKMESYPGTVVIPFYANPAFTAFQQQQIQSPQPQKGGGEIHIRIGPGAMNPPDNAVVSCQALERISVLGTCPAGTKAVTLTPDNVLSGDNPLFVYKGLPIVTTHNVAYTGNLSALPLNGMLIKPDNSSTLEQIRTYLTIYNANSQYSGAAKGQGDLSSWQMGELEPETIGEVAEIRNNDDSNVGRAVLAVIALTLVTAGCSLAVTVGGSLVERKRSFTLMRVSGVSLGTLYKVILLEAVLPLIVVSVIAAGIGLGVGIPVVKSLITGFEPNADIPVHPSVGYYISIGAGLVISVLLVMITLPILKNTTKPEDARFE